MEQLPVFVHTLFILTTLLAVYLFYKASAHSKITLMVLTAWLVIQALVAFSGFYEKPGGLPPRFALLFLPPVFFIAMLFATKKGRRYLDGLNMPALTLVHIVRIPVELVLFALFLHHVIPQVMTFEGRNLDILSGITAPLIYYFIFIKPVFSKKVALLWNFAALALLINVVTHALLSIPSAFQQIAFDQPNIAVLYFPFVWLPSCVVPLVLLSHLATIRQLLKNN